MSLKFPVQVPVTVVEFDGEHVGEGVVVEQEHVVVGDGADGVVIEYGAVLVADDDGDVLQSVGRGQHERVAVVAKHRQEEGLSMAFGMAFIVIALTLTE